MELTWHPATLKDIKLLTKLRIDILRTEQKNEESSDMSDILVQTYEYYKEALTNDTCTAYLVYDGEEIIGTGEIGFSRILPTPENLTGRTAHIMNLYVHPDYRRQGVAYRTIALLLADANKRGIRKIMLEATGMNGTLFAGFGFIPEENCMKLQSCQNTPEFDITMDEEDIETVVPVSSEAVKNENMNK